MNPRLVAFFLPQFHPIPENDAWWGNGFTEWTNVAKARPLFRGHYQPHLPADLGFYDLRLPEVRRAQADLARAYGIHGFCYYHYWFNGKRLLERPVDEILASGEPDFPFCLCWANENWTRTWDGGDKQVLLPQEHSYEDDVRHMEWLCGALADERYIRIDGRPLLLIYRPSLLPNAAQTVATWRAVAAANGLGDLFLCNVENFGSERGVTTKWSFDGAVEFAPDFGQTGWFEGRGKIERLLRAFGKRSAHFEHYVYLYSTLVERMLNKPTPDYLRFPCVTPMWDNSARRKRDAAIFVDSTPELYERWLSATLQRLATRVEHEQVCFINAWNEWAEGCHLEPCQRWGRQYLEATRRAQAGVARTNEEFANVSVPQCEDEDS